MLVAADGRARRRAVGLWCVVTAAAGGIGAMSVPSLAGGHPAGTGAEAGFAELLVDGCAAATLVAAAWLWAICTDVAVRLLRGGGNVGHRPGAVRLLLLAACGAVVLGTTAGPASADDRHPASPDPLSGLPLPDRATGAASPPPDHGATVRVRTGDSLWAIAEDRLGERASVAEIADYWHRIYARNAAVIGPDPALILPGQVLELPPTT